MMITACRSRWSISRRRASGWSALQRSIVPLMARGYPVDRRHTRVDVLATSRGAAHAAVAGTQSLFPTFDDQEEFSVDHVPDLFLRVFVLMEFGGTLGDLPVPECHVLEWKNRPDHPGSGEPW